MLADGSFVTASKEKNPDLLWALRGGGGNFGVVTSFLFQLHPVKMVFAGPIAWDQKHARTIMQRYREVLPKAPEELGAFVGLKKIPSSAPFPQEIWGKHICLLMSCYNGSEADGKKALAPLLEGLPEPFFNWMGTMPYPAVQSMFDGLYPKGMQWYWRGDFVKTLPDAAIDAHLEQAAKTPSELVPHAPLPDRWRRSAHGQGRYGVELPRRHLVDGYCRHRPRSQQEGGP